MGRRRRRSIGEQQGSWADTLGKQPDAKWERGSVAQRGAKIHWAVGWEKDRFPNSLSVVETSHLGLLRVSQKKDQIKTARCSEAGVKGAAGVGVGG